MSWWYNTYTALGVNRLFFRNGPNVTAEAAVFRRLWPMVGHSHLRIVGRLLPLDDTRVVLPLQEIGACETVVRWPTTKTDHGLISAERKAWNRDVGISLCVRVGLFEVNPVALVPLDDFNAFTDGMD